MAGNSPDFIGIGAQRSGTSWMASCFWEHKQIFMPGKELHFFDADDEINIADYFAKFDRPDQKQGEFTPDYLSNKLAIDRIASHCPNSKLIIILREPTARTISSFNLYRERGQISPDTSLNDIFASNHSVYEKSLYGRQIEYLFSKFDPQQVQVFFYDQINSDPVALIQSVYAFIGVESSFVPGCINRNFNSSSIAFENPALNSYLTNAQNYLAKRKWGHKLLSVKKTRAFTKFKSNLIKKKQAKAAKLTQDASFKHYFADDLKLLESLIDKPLPQNWL